jgi:hypothetical protein
VLQNFAHNRSKSTTPAVVGARCRSQCNRCKLVYAKRAWGHEFSENPKAVRQAIRRRIGD